MMKKLFCSSAFTCIAVLSLAQVDVSTSTHSTIPSIRSSKSYSAGGTKIALTSYGAQYSFEANNTAADDGMLVIRPAGIAASTPGRWVYVVKNGVYNLKDFGVVGDGSTNNRGIIQGLINKMTDASRSYTIFLPRGNYYCDSTIVLHNKSIHFAGDGAAGTVLSFPASVKGIVISGMGGNLCIIEKLAILAKSKNPNDGHLGFKSSNPRSLNRDDYFYHGIEVIKTCVLRDVYIGYFSGHGLFVHADVGLGSNASLSEFDHVIVQGSYGAGVCVYGQDANHMIFKQLDTRDNKFVGVYDSSFLGNTYVSPHANNNDYGHYWDLNPNSRGTYLDWYGESGTAPSKLYSAHVAVFGGIHEAPVHGKGVVFEGAKVNTIAWNRSGSNDGFAITVNPEVYKDPSFIMAHYSKPIRLYSRDNMFGYTHFMQEFPNIDLFMAQVGEMHKIMETERAFPVMSGGTYGMHGFRSVVIGRRVFQTVTNVTARFDIPYINGDVLYNENYNGTNPSGWICTRSGQSGTYQEGLRARADNGNILKLSAATKILRPGMTIVVNGTAATINSFQDATTLVMNKNIPTGSSLAITYQSPQFKAYGTGIGKTTERPVLNPDDEGWRYFDVDQSSWFTWMRGGWVKDGSGSSKQTNYIPKSTKDKNGNTGDMGWDDKYFYIKTNAGWKRSALVSF